MGIMVVQLKPFRKVTCNWKSQRWTPRCLCTGLVPSLSPVHLPLTCIDSWVSAVSPAKLPACCWLATPSCMSHHISLHVHNNLYLLNIFSDKTLQRSFSPVNASDLAASTTQGRTNVHEVRLGAEPGGMGFWWAMPFNAMGTFGSVLGSAHAVEQVRLTCVCRESRSSCAANGTYGDPGLCVTSPATRSRHPCFPWRNLAAPGHYSSALSFYLVLGGRWVSGSTGCALRLVLGAASMGLARLTCARHTNVCQSA